MSSLRWVVPGFVIGLVLAVAPACGMFGGDKCNASTCPAGCCSESGRCESGVVTNACGVNGNACKACGTSEGCNGGVCAPFNTPGTDGGNPTDGGTDAGVCDSTTCNTCCSSGQCVAAIGNLTCGSGGGACEACTGANTCNTVSGTCEMITGCDSTNCAGCCDGAGVCQTGNTAGTCGLGGGACAACAGTETCSNGTCQTATCGAGNCAGCCQNNQCQTGTAQGACGAGGGACVACSGTQTCNGGTCTGGTTCGTGNCNGCCLNNVCQPGTAANACGANGVTCATCSGTQTCSGGTCTGGTTCGAGNCNGCCQNNVCQTGNTVGACGLGGNTCAMCPANQTCNAGTCQTTTMNCFVPASYGSVTGTGPFSQGVASSRIVYQAQLNTDPDFILIDLYAQFGVFTGNVQPGTYNLANDTANYETCGACVLVFADYDQATGASAATYIAVSGTLTLTSVSGQLTGSLSNASFIRVTLGSGGATTPVNDGCVTQISSHSFNQTIQPPPP